ncbi:MAG TPA: carboxylesterase family protein, partial [Longimicrobiaceae bacterium]|nr:carboxylesterase family protein [Longimicrobiaceae bacterium]
VSLAALAGCGRSAAVGSIACSGPTAAAAAGSLCGATEKVAVGGDSATVNVFRGIRYATARRWQPPTGYTWTGVDTAVAAGPICPQPAEAGGPPQSEDCLFLNVWAPPGSTPADTLPVMVFIHGGAFVTGAGSSPLYDGGYLAAVGKVVVVTLNYRLGPLGFLYLGKSYGQGTNGNFGLLDQQQALTWVQSNISAFGGDPKKVTVFGESAGAMSVGLHLFSIPTSKTLFRAAIMESNPMGVVYRDTVRAKKDASVYVDTICSIMGRRGKTCTRTLDSLQTVPLETVMSAALVFDTTHAINRIIFGQLSEALPWAPTVDGSFVLQQPYLGYADSMPVKPLVFGMNRDEGVIFAAMAQHKDSTVLDSTRYGLLVRVMFPGNGSTILTYPGILAKVKPYKASGHALIPPLMETESALAQLIVDYAFASGNLAAANRARGQGKPVYGYLFQQKPFFNLYAGLSACAPPNPYVCHAYELPYVFNSLGYVRTANGVNGTIQPSDTTMARRMATAWTTFARTLSTPEPGWAEYSASASVWVLDGTTSGSMLSTLPETSNATKLWFTIPPLSQAK